MRTPANQNQVPVPQQAMPNLGQAAYQQPAGYAPPSQAPGAMTGAPPQASHPMVEANYLIQFATPLLNLMTQLRHTAQQQNVARLQAQIIEEVKRFQQKCVQVQYPDRMIVAARYCLCTAIDEAVLSRPWGSQGVWAQQTLLSIFHRETWGGERFYIIIEDMARDTRRNLDFLEFVYFLLSLGFEGKYFNQLEIREEIRNRIFYRIRNARSKPETALVHLFQTLSNAQKKQNIRMKVKRIMLTTLAALVIGFGYFNYRVYHSADSVYKRLDKLAQVSPVTSFSQVIKRSLVAHHANS